MIDDVVAGTPAPAGVGGIAIAHSSLDDDCTGVLDDDDGGI